MTFVPSWGGSMFESLMPDLLVPETKWGPKSWQLNHPITVAVQKQHGLDEAGYGYWGFSPASDPFGGYAEYGVDLAGMRSDGYTSDAREDRRRHRPARVHASGTNPDPEFGDGVVTPHAASWRCPTTARACCATSRSIETDLGAYGPGGFYDAVAVKSGTVAERYLSLDQSMIMAAIGNELTRDTLKDYFVDREMEKLLRPAMRRRYFGSVVGTESAVTRLSPRSLRRGQERAVGTDGRRPQVAAPRGPLRDRAGATPGDRRRGARGLLPHGFHSGSLREIAKRVGLTPTGLMHHFATRRSCSPRCSASATRRCARPRAIPPSTR